MRRSSRKKNSTRLFIAAAILAAAVFGVANYFFNQNNDAVIAKVNDTKIFKSEVEKKLQNVFEGQNQEAKIPNINDLPKEVVEILVREIYLEKELTKEAKKSSAVKSQENRDKIADAENRILRQAYIDSILKEEITDEKINEKYVELTNELAGKKEYQVSHIVVKTKEEAEKVLRDLKVKKSE